METKELKIQIPEGYEIDKENSSFEKIIFKKKDTKPRSWEEYCNNYTGKAFYIGKDSTICGGNDAYGLFTEVDKNILPTRELAEAFLAMMQLMSLRQAWIGDCNPNLFGYAILLDVVRNVIVSHDVYHKALTFPNREMAIDFMNCFKDLLEIAKPLI